jgi:hypothetical protein
MRAGLLLLVLGVLAAPADAHPGRLDRDGCHQVHTRFVHASGQVDEPGTRHCHRHLDQGLVLDGTEQLRDESQGPLPTVVPGVVCGQQGWAVTCWRVD